MAKAAPKNFESALSELEQLVAALESGSLPLSESLAAYQRGAALLKYAQGELAAVEQQVKLLEGDTLRPFAAWALDGDDDEDDDHEDDDGRDDDDD